MEEAQVDVDVSEQQKAEAGDNALFANLQKAYANVNDHKGIEEPLEDLLKVVSGEEIRKKISGLEEFYEHYNDEFEKFKKNFLAKAKNDDEAKQLINFWEENQLKELKKVIDKNICI